MTGGAAASPVAGPTATAAMFGTEGLAGVSRLGEMVMAIGIVYTPHFFRVARSGSISISARPFVLASRLIGAKDSRILVVILFRTFQHY